MHLAKHHRVDTIAFAGAEEAEKELELVCGTKVYIPKFDTAELLERVNASARLHLDIESKQALDNLYELHHLRSKFWSLPQIPHFNMKRPKWISGVSVTSSVSINTY